MRLPFNKHSSKTKHGTVSRHLKLKVLVGVAFDNGLFEELWTEVVFDFLDLTFGQRTIGVLMEPDYDVEPAILV